MKNPPFVMRSWELQSCKGERHPINWVTNNYLIRVTVSLLKEDHLAQEATLLGSKRVPKVGKSRSDMM